MTVLPPSARLNRDAALMNQAPGQPDAHQLAVAAQQQGAMEQVRAQTQLPQASSGVRRDLDEREQRASQMAYLAKQAIQNLAGPDALPGRAGVLAMAAQAREGVHPLAEVMERIGMPIA